MYRVDGIEQSYECQDAASRAIKGGQHGDLVDERITQDAQPNNSISHKDGAGDIGFGPALLVSSALVGTAPSQSAESAEGGPLGTRPHTRVKSEEPAPLQCPRQTTQWRVGMAYSDEGGGSRIGSNSSDGCDKERMKKRICRTPSMVREHLHAEDAGLDASTAVFHGKEGGMKMELKVSAPFPPLRK